jgi:hypothetical protein
MPVDLTDPIKLLLCVKVIFAPAATETLLVPLDIELVLTPPMPDEIALSIWLCVYVSALE